MANLSAIFRESAKYLRERERDPRSARLSFEVMLIKLGYIIQQMRKGGAGKHARIYAMEVIARIRFIPLPFFFFVVLPFFPAFRAASRMDFLSFVSKFLSCEWNRNNSRHGGILVFLRDVRNLNWRTASNYLFLNANQILHFFIFKNCTSYFHFRASF